MRLHLSVGDPSREVVVDAPPGTRAGELAVALGFETHIGLHVDGQAVPLETLLGAPPLLDGAHLTDGAPHPPQLPTSSTTTTQAWEVRVIAGPASGLRWRLPCLATTIGRGESADLLLDDPQASRLHVRLTPGDESVAVHDLGSRNGTTLDGSPIGQDGAQWRKGQRLRVGDSELEVRRAAAASTSTSRPDGQGHLLVGQAPSSRQPAVPTQVRFPRPPEATGSTPAPWLAAAIPLALSVVLAVVMSSPAMLLFGLAGPLLLLGSWWSARRQGRRAHRSGVSPKADQEARVDLCAALDAEAEAARAEHPDPADVLAWAQDRRSRLWERRPTDSDALPVRLGLGAVPAAHTTATDAPGDLTLTLPDSPVALDLRAHRVAGIVGPRQATLAAARNLVGRLVTALPPSALTVTVVVGDGAHGDEWSWTRRLPHCRLLGDDQLVAAPLAPDPHARTAATDRLTQVAADAATTGHLVVLDGSATLRDVPAVAALLDTDNVCVLALDTSRDRLPHQATAVLRLQPTHAELQLPTGTVQLSPDLPCGLWSCALARALQPLRDGAPTRRRATLPRELRLLDLDDTPTNVADLAARWRAAPRTPYPLLGATPAGPLRVDLTGEGPHALVAGTTGAGKSELLQTLVCSLALDHPPDALVVLLVDYKGGAALRECARLPHCVGLVTDLDEHLAGRVLTSLTAEVRRRERLLAQAGTADLEAYQRIWATRPDLEPVPRLVVVVDEFRVLAEELPAFVQGMVRIAAVGRSLGLHLVLATQRPAGVVTADIRANVGLRIALRVRDRSDSQDVIDAPDAALLDAATPGRALLRGGLSSLTALQVGRVTVGEPEPPVLTVSACGPPWLPPPGPPPRRSRAGPTDVQRIVEMAGEATRRYRVPLPRRPWLDPLPAVVPLAALGDAEGFAPLGLVDDPARQEQRTFAWDGAGHLGIAGGPGSGRTTTLLTVAWSLATRHSPTEVHVYALGRLSQLQSLGSLPHTAFIGDVRRRDDLALLVRRLEQLSTAREDGSAVVLVDGWEALAGHRPRPGRCLVDLARSGGDSPLRLVVTGGRSVLAGQVAALCTSRIVLGLSDPVDAALAGLSPRDLPRNPPPGRGVVVSGALELQVADPTGSPVREWDSTGAPTRIRRLPDAVPLASLPPAPGAELPVGVRAGDLATVGFAPSRGERRVVVVGPPGSGRTNALAVLGASLVSRGRPLAVIGSTLAERLGVPAVADAEQLVRRRTTHPGLALIVDDGERLAGTPLDPVIRELARCVDEDGGFVALATTPTWLGRAFASYGAELAASRTGLLLGPTPADPGLLGLARLPPELGDDRPPGRGVLVASGRPTVVQVARP